MFKPLPIVAAIVAVLTLNANCQIVFTNPPPTPPTMTWPGGSVHNISWTTGNLTRNPTQLTIYSVGYTSDGFFKLEQYRNSSGGTDVTSPFSVTISDFVPSCQTPFYFQINTTDSTGKSVTYTSPFVVITPGKSFTSEASSLLSTTGRLSQLAMIGVGMKFLFGGFT